MKNDKLIGTLAQRLGAALDESIRQCVAPGDTVHLDFSYCKERFTEAEADDEGNVTVTYETYDEDDGLTYRDSYALERLDLGEKLALWKVLKENE